ncbi:hypothetical protein EVAR_63679_1 [Eumeta japonica]|uniref:Uncharacterized protein n=1 Tax=Eumeta variegata TaxID=151549 RepID=A0A4C1ZNB3_EUMVA|nr:hypothetical protein EVAR_63679_1 [Eumeta japonica]
MRSNATARREPKQMYGRTGHRYTTATVRREGPIRGRGRRDESLVTPKNMIWPSVMRRTDRREVVKSVLRRGSVQYKVMTGDDPLAPGEEAPVAERIPRYRPVARPCYLLPFMSLAWRRDGVPLKRPAERASLIDSLKNSTRPPQTGEQALAELCLRLRDDTRRLCEVYGTILTHPPARLRIQNTVDASYETKLHEFQSYK